MPTYAEIGRECGCDWRTVKFVDMDVFQDTQLLFAAPSAQAAAGIDEAPALTG